MAAPISAELRSAFDKFKIPFSDSGGLGSQISRATTPTWASGLNQGDPKLGGRTRFVGIEIQSSNVLAGLATLAGSFRMGAQIPAQRAPEWRAMIVAETPRGAEFRVQPKRYNLPFAPENLTLDIASPAKSMSKKYSKSVASELEHAVRFMEGDKDLFRHGTLDTRIVKGYARQFGIEYEAMMSYMGRGNAAVAEASIQGEGRLQQSVQVKVDSDVGYSSATAFSDSYYAWFVEEGYEDVLMPVFPNSKADIVAVVPLEQLGEGDGYDYQKFAFSRSGGDIDWFSEDSTATAMGASGMWVKMARRPEPISRPGQFMFAKGTNKFMAQFESQFAMELDRMVQLAQEKNIRFDTMVRQWRGASGKGNKGSFLSRAVAQGAADV